MKRILLLVFCLLPAAVATAEDVVPQASGLPPALREYYSRYSGTVPEGLAYDMDLWHDAVLKGNKEQAALYEKRIDAVLTENLAVQEKLIASYAGRAVEEVYGDSINADQPELADADFSRAISANGLFAEVYQIFQAKRKIHLALKTTDSFSNRCRLLGDFVELLRRELGMPRLRMANALEEEPTNTSGSQKD